jgi:inner membrane transporter RhtA
MTCSTTRDASATPSGGLLERIPSPGLVIGAITSVQFGSAIATTLFAKIGPGGAVLMRMLFGAILVGALWRPRLRDRSRRDLALAALFGLVLAGMNFSFYSAIHRIPLGIGVTLEFVGPLAVAIFGSRRWLDLLWAALAAGGIIALTHGQTHGLDTLGVGLALLAGCLWGIYILVNARVGRVFERGTGLALALCVALIAMIPAGIVEGGPHLFDARSLALGAAVGLLSSAIPYSFEVEALRRIAPAVFGVLMSIEPAMGALAGLVVLGQSLSWRAIAGIALVVCASIGASLRAREAPVAV